MYDSKEENGKFIPIAKDTAITETNSQKTKLFIATQTPLENTISSFWKMIYNHKIKLVIMLLNIVHH